MKKEKPELFKGQKYIFRSLFVRFADCFVGLKSYSKFALKSF